MDKKYISCMILHALGDTIGFKNGEWEFKQTGGYERGLEKLYEFISLGGVNHISLKDWNVSDDTILHIQTAISLLEADFNNMNEFGNILKKNYLDALEQFETEGMNIRYPGIATMEYLKRLRDGGNWDDTPYDKRAGGSGASMRNLCIGLAFHGKENRHKLIQVAIESSRITHNNTIGYLGGLASALFVALAIEGVVINDWPFILIDLFNSNTIFKYIKASRRGEYEFMVDSHIFIDKWQRYIDDKFDKDRNPIKRKSMENLVYRSNYYKNNYGYKFIDDTEHQGIQGIHGTQGEIKTSAFIGSGGDDSVIIAYDSLLDSGNNWEKLIIYSMLHIGDTDTTGAIAAGFYGVLYGLNDVPTMQLEYLEYKNVLEDLGLKLYNKYYAQ